MLALLQLWREEHFDSEGAVSKGLEATHKQNTPLPDNRTK